MRRTSRYSSFINDFWPLAAFLCLLLVGAYLDDPTKVTGAWLSGFWLQFDHGLWAIVVWSAAAAFFCYGCSRSIYNFATKTDQLRK